MFDVCGTTVFPYLGRSTPLIFMLTTSYGIVIFVVVNELELEGCDRQLSQCIACDLL